MPDDVADGCFSTGAIVMTGPSEFIVDFLQTIGRPHRVARRVVIPHPVMPQFIEALNTNLDLYKSRFGEPPAPPTQNPNQARRPTPQEIYDDLKMPDEVLSGVYANGVMIGHGASEFGLDFLTASFRNQPSAHACLWRQDKCRDCWSRCVARCVNWNSANREHRQPEANHWAAPTVTAANRTGHRLKVPDAMAILHTAIRHPLRMAPMIHRRPQVDPARN